MGDGSIMTDDLMIALLSVFNFGHIGSTLRHSQYTKQAIFASRWGMESVVALVHNVTLHAAFVTRQYVS